MKKGVMVVLGIFLTMWAINACNQDVNDGHVVSPEVSDFGGEDLANLYTTGDVFPSLQDIPEYEWRGGIGGFCVSISRQGEYLLSYYARNTATGVLHGPYYLAFHALQPTWLHIGLEHVHGDRLERLYLHYGRVLEHAQPLEIHQGHTLVYAIPSRPEIAWTTVMEAKPDEEGIPLNVGQGYCGGYIPPILPTPTPVPQSITDAAKASCTAPAAQNDDWAWFSDWGGACIRCGWGPASSCPAGFSWAWSGWMHSEQQNCWMCTAVEERYPQP